eukprot:2751207-Amphidinium_carterae.1
MAVQWLEDRAKQPERSGKGSPGVQAWPWLWAGRRHPPSCSLREPAEAAGSCSSSGSSPFAMHPLMHFRSLSRSIAPASSASPKGESCVGGREAPGAVAPEATTSRSAAEASASYNSLFSSMHCASPATRDSLTTKMRGIFGFFGERQLFFGQTTYTHVYFDQFFSQGIPGCHSLLNQFGLLIHFGCDGLCLRKELGR